MNYDLMTFDDTLRVTAAPSPRSALVPVYPCDENYWQLIRIFADHSQLVFRSWLWSTPPSIQF